MSSGPADEARNAQPDRTDAGASAARSDAGVGGAIAPQADPEVAPGVVAGDARNGTQDVPAMHGNDTTTKAKIDGIVAQTRADFPSGSDPVEVEHALRQRFRDAAMDVGDDEIRKLAAG